jgi:hypothetical protein
MHPPLFRYLVVVRSLKNGERAGWMHINALDDLEAIARARRAWGSVAGAFVFSAQCVRPLKPHPWASMENFLDTTYGTT